MPELPEVETVVRTLEDQLQAAIIKSVEVYWDNIIVGDVETFKRDIQNQQIECYSRIGKYLLFELTDWVLIVHLRMEGKFYIQTLPEKSKHIHVIFSLDKNRYLAYHDTRKFGKMQLVRKLEVKKVLSKLGKDALDPTLTSLELYTAWHKKQISLKQMLLDQSFVAGIGNIYANEICFACRLHPATNVSHLSKKDFENILMHSVAILKQACLAGGTTIRSYTSSLGVTGLFQLNLMVHGRSDQACVECGTTIIKIMHHQRGTYLCPMCQKKK